MEDCYQEQAIEMEQKSEYSELSYESDDLDEGAVNETNWGEIEEANRDGVSHKLFKTTRKHAFERVSSSSSD